MKISEPTTSHLLLYPGLSHENYWRLLNSSMHRVEIGQHPSQPP